MRLAAATAAVIIGLDQISKLIVVHWLGLAERLAIDVLPPYLNFRMAWNRGVNFGLFASDGEATRWVLIAVALAICAFVWLWVGSELRAGNAVPDPWRARPRVQLSAGLLVGGALGNVIDRLAYGAVADFINMSCCGIDNPFAFNLADAAIFAGAVGLVLFTGAGGKKTP